MLIKPAFAASSSSMLLILLITTAAALLSSMMLGTQSSSSSSSSLLGVQVLQVDAFQARDEDVTILHYLTQKDLEEITFLLDKNMDKKFNTINDKLDTIMKKLSNIEKDQRKGGGGGGVGGSRTKQ